MKPILSQYRHPVGSTHEIRVFLSSTFRDMTDEREELVLLFTRLRSEAMSRGVGITLVDLRWGITEEESTTGKVLEICLDQIVRSRPYFIGLVGCRYGWRPSAADIGTLAERKGYEWIADDIAAGLSITEIEMQYGVLRNEKPLNAFFYIKDNCRTEAVDEAEACSLNRLRSAIENSGRYPFRYYSHASDLANAVEADFMDMLERDYPRVSANPDDRLETAEQLRRLALLDFYIPIAQYDSAMLDFIASDRRQMLVSGAKGIGKSALLAHWSDILSTGDRTVIYHTLSSAEQTCNAGRLADSLARKCREAFSRAGLSEAASLMRGCDDPTAPMAGIHASLQAIEGLAETMGRRFADNAALNIREIEEDRTAVKSLGELSEALRKSHVPVIILIDDIDSLEGDGKELRQFLAGLPTNIKLIATSQDTEFQPYFSQTMEMRPLGRDATARFITDYLARFSKALSRRQLDTVASWPLSSNPQLLKALLWELVRYGSFEGLDSYIAGYTSAADSIAFYTRLVRRVLGDCHNDSKAADALLALGVADAGITEDEAKLICGVSQLAWIQLREELGENLFNDNGLYSLANSGLAQAIRNHFGRDRVDDMRTKIIGLFSEPEFLRSELTIADYNMRMKRFRYRDEYRHTAEVIAQLATLAGDIDALQTSITDAAVFEILYRNRPDLLRRAWDIVTAATGVTPSVYAEVPLDSIEPSLKPVVINDMAAFTSSIPGKADDALAIGRRIDSIGGIPLVAQAVLDMNQGCRLAKDGKYAQSYPWFHKAIDSLEAIEPLPLREIANTRRNLAFALFYDDHNAEAARQAWLAFEFYRDYTDSKSQENAADCVRLIAWGYNLSGQHIEALPYFPRAIHSIETDSGPNCKRAIQTLTMYAESLAATGNRDFALDIYRKALERTSQRPDRYYADRIAEAIEKLGS